MPTAYTIIARFACDGLAVSTLPVGNAVFVRLTAGEGPFCVTVRASNAAGPGPESASVSFRVSMVPQAPLARPTRR